MKAQSTTKEKLWTRSYILTILVNFTALSIHYVLLISMPLYITSLGGSNGQAGLTTGLYALTALIMRPLIGSLLDSHSKKLILSLGTLPFLIGITLMCFTDSINLLIATRIIHGIGFSIISTACVTIISDIAPVSRMGEGISNIGATESISNAVGPIIALMVINIFGFTSLYINLLPVMGLSLIFALLLPKDLGKSSDSDKTEKTNRPRSGNIMKYFSIEKSAVITSIPMVFNVLSYGCIVTFLASYGKTRGIENMQFFFTISPIFLILTRFITGRISDRYGVSIVLIPSIIIAGIALVIIAFAETIPVFALAAAIYGIGFASLQPLFTALAVKNCPPEKRGGANATVYIALDLGMGGGSIVLGILANYFGFSAIFLVSAGFMVVSLIYYLILMKTGQIEGGASVE